MINFKKKFVSGIFFRALFLPSSLLLPICLKLNQFDYSWLSMIYSSIAIAIFTRLGFDRRYFAYITKKGFPPLIIICSIIFTSSYICIYYNNFYLLGVALLIASSLALTISFRAESKFIIANLFDVPAISFFFSCISFLGSDITLLISFILGVSFSCYALLRKTNKQFGVKNCMACVSLKAALNSSAGYLMQSIANECLVLVNIGNDIAYKIRISERLAFSLTFMNTASFLVIQNLALSTIGIQKIRVIGRYSLFLGIILFFLFLFLIPFYPNFVALRFFILFSVLYLLTLTLPPIGHAGDQLKSTNLLFNNNLCFIGALLLAYVFSQPILGFSLYALSVFFERVLICKKLKLSAFNLSS